MEQKILKSWDTAGGGGSGGKYNLSWWSHRCKGAEIGAPVPGVEFKAIETGMILFIDLVVADFLFSTV